MEKSIALPWERRFTLDAGTSVSINLIGDKKHTNNMTLTIYENGSIAKQHVIDEEVTGGELHPNPALTHVVGQ
ncbi:MAG: hypothetical protein R6V29_09450 [Spirochaetia bacterium]